MGPNVEGYWNAKRLNHSLTKFWLTIEVDMSSIPFVWCIYFHDSYPILAVTHAHPMRLGFGGFDMRYLLDK